MAGPDLDGSDTANTTHVTKPKKRRRGNGEGSVWLAKDERRKRPWAAVVVRGWDAYTGGAIRTTRFFATEEEAINAVAEMSYRRDAGLVMPTEASLRRIARRRSGAQRRRVSRPAATQISKRLRFDVLVRDDFACTYCGRRPPEVSLHVDHVQPVTLGGDASLDNLATACRDCNLGKAARYTSTD